jgi:cell division protein FtsB
METFITVLLLLLFGGTPIFLGIQNSKQEDEIKKLNNKINQLKAENESLMKNIRTLCLRRDSGKKNLHDIFCKN